MNHLGSCKNADFDSVKSVKGHDSAFLILVHEPQTSHRAIPKTEEVTKDAKEALSAEISKAMLCLMENDPIPY